MASDHLIYRTLRQALEAGRPALLATVIAARDGYLPGKKGLLITSAENGRQWTGTLESPWLEAVRSKAEELADQREPGRRVRVEVVAVGDQVLRVAFERFDPAWPLVIAGAGHIAQPTHEFAAKLGFAVTVLDDRPAYANSERFPYAQRILCADFVEGIRSLDIDERTALVIVTRGHLHDTQVLRAVRDRRPAYVGMIGSRRRVLTVIETLRAEGTDEEFLDMIYAPIGLDIGAESPEEIALSIVAEIVCVLKGGTGGHLRQRLPKLGRREEKA